MLRVHESCGVTEGGLARSRWTVRLSDQSEPALKSALAAPASARRRPAHSPPHNERKNRTAFAASSIGCREPRRSIVAQPR